MKLIPLSKEGKNRGKYFAMVDDEDYDYLMQWNWSVIKRTKGLFYAGRTEWYGDGKGQKHIKMHRLLLGLNDPKIEVDHKDHNGLNNQRNNLRAVTHQQNLFNGRASGESKYIGVGRRRFGGKWCASVTVNRKKCYVGYFDDEIEAAKARDVAAKKLHGEFARLNFSQ